MIEKAWHSQLGFRENEESEHLYAVCYRRIKDSRVQGRVNLTDKDTELF